LLDPHSANRLDKAGRAALATDRMKRVSSTHPKARRWGVGPKVYQCSPERLREQVSDLLEDRGEIDASDIEVKVEGTTVELTGT
jgi:osmotically-inducible protein OsmY